MKTGSQISELNIMQDRPTKLTNNSFTGRSNQTWFFTGSLSILLTKSKDTSHLFYAFKNNPKPSTKTDLVEFNKTIHDS